jgi:hypothetical protein
MTKHTLTIKILQQHLEQDLETKKITHNQINLGQKLLIHGECSLKNQAELAQYFGFIPVLNLFEK